MYVNSPYALMFGYFSLAFREGYSWQAFAWSTMALAILRGILWRFRLYNYITLWLAHEPAQSVRYYGLLLLRSRGSRDDVERHQCTSIFCRPNFIHSLRCCLFWAVCLLFGISLRVTPLYKTERYQRNRVCTTDNSVPRGTPASPQPSVWLCISPDNTPQILI